MSNAEYQPMIVEILSEYLSSEDMPSGQFEELLAKLIARDVTMQNDCYRIGLRSGLRRARNAIDQKLDNLKEN
jgi:hypothetical protein